jgi:hypothetical protein
MKFPLFLFLFLILAYKSFAQDFFDFEILGKKDFKGSIKKCEYVHSKIREGNWVETNTGTTEFYSDMSIYKVSQISFIDLSRYDVSFYYYDSQRQLSEAILYDYRGSFKNRKTFVRTKNLLVSTDQRQRIDSVFYDNKNRIVREKFMREGKLLSYYKYQYNAAGDTILKEDIQSGNINYTVYNISGQVVEGGDVKSGKFIPRSLYEYKDDLLMKFTIIHSETGKRYPETYTYVFDKKGNWIERENFGAKEKLKITRKITYPE